MERAHSDSSYKIGQCKSNLIVVRVTDVTFYFREEDVRKLAKCLLEVADECDKITVSRRWSLRRLVLYNIEEAMTPVKVGVCKKSGRYMSVVINNITTMITYDNARTIANQLLAAADLKL